MHVKPSALAIYCNRHELDLETIRILPQLSDDIVELVRAAVAADTELTAPGNRPGVPGWLARLRDRIRRNEPALAALSDEEFECALDVAVDTNADMVAPEELQ